MKFPCIFVAMVLTVVEAHALDSLKSIKDVKAQHQEFLLSVEGVVSVGIGKNDAGSPCIVVGVKDNTEKLLQKIPSTLDGYTVRVETVGDLNAL